MCRRTGSAELVMDHPTFPARTVIFDLDGTLVDTAPDLAAAANRLLVRHGRRPLPLETLRNFVGGGARLLLERAFAAAGTPLDPVILDTELLPAFLSDYEAHIADRSRPYPGVRATLTALREEGHILAIATNKPQKLTEALLRVLGLGDIFAAVIGRDAAPRPKPDRAHLDHALTMSGGKLPAVMVGDSITDLEAARAAGLPAILVPYGYTAEPAHSLGADLVLADFAALTDCLRPA